MALNLNDRTAFSAVFAAFALTGLVISVFSLFRRYRRNTHLEKHGILSNAIVKRRRLLSGKYLRHELDYEFVVNGRRYECLHQHIYADTHSRLKEGDVVQVKYLANNPAQSKLAGTDDTSDYDWGCLFVVVFIFMTIVAFGVNLFPQR
jgi:hypothetical protein